MVPLDLASLDHETTTSGGALASTSHTNGHSADEDNTTTALFEVDPVAATPRSERPQSVHPPVVLVTSAMPSSIAKLGMEENKGDPPVTLLDNKETSFIQTVCLIFDMHVTTPLWPVASQFTATPSSMAGLGSEEEDGNPRIALLDFKISGAKTAPALLPISK